MMSTVRRMKMSCRDELFYLMQQHPELPVIPIVDAEVCGEDYALYMATITSVAVSECAIFNDMYFDDRADFKETYYNYHEELAKRFNYNPRINDYTKDEYTHEQVLSNMAALHALEEELDKIADSFFQRAILIYIGTSEVIK